MLRLKTNARGSGNQVALLRDIYNYLFFFWGGGDWTIRTQDDLYQRRFVPKLDDLYPEFSGRFVPLSEKFIP